MPKINKLLDTVPGPTTHGYKIGQIKEYASSEGGYISYIVTRVDLRVRDNVQYWDIYGRIHEDRSYII